MDDNDRLRTEGPENLDPMAGLSDPDMPPRFDEFVDDALRHMLRRAKGDEKGIPTPWGKLSVALGGGLWPGVTVLVGNTGSGKTQFALQICLSAAIAGIPVVYIGLELSSIEIIARVLGIMIDQQWSHLLLGKDKFAIESGARLRDRFAELPLHLQQGPLGGWSYSQLEQLVSSLRQEYPEETPGDRPMLVVIDYVQLVASPPGVREDLRERIGRAAYAARAVARMYNASVMLLSSTARENYRVLDGDSELGAGNPSRLVGLGKESGEIEYAADAVLVLAREPWVDGQSPVDGTHVWCALAKGRAVKTCWVPFRFDGNRFHEAKEGTIEA